MFNRLNSRTTSTISIENRRLSTFAMCNFAELIQVIIGAMLFRYKLGKSMIAFALELCQRLAGF